MYILFMSLYERSKLELIAVIYNFKSQGSILEVVENQLNSLDLLFPPPLFGQKL